jgi:hypothetical protein
MGGGGEEREGEGSGAHLGVQIQRSPSPKPRAPWGERGSCCAGELNEGKRPGVGGARMGEGRGARSARARARPSWDRPGRAGLGRIAGQNHEARTTTDQNSIRETKSETRLSNTRD